VIHANFFVGGNRVQQSAVWLAGSHRGFGPLRGIERQMAVRQFNAPVGLPRNIRIV
jgi:hypothetical protein